MSAGTGDLNTIVDLLAATLAPCTDDLGFTVRPRGYNESDCLPIINIRPIEGDRADRGRCQAQFVITAYAEACSDAAWTLIYTVMSPCTDGSILKCLRGAKSTLASEGYELKFDSPRNFGLTPWDKDKNNAYAAQVVVTVSYCCCTDGCFQG